MPPSAPPEPFSPRELDIVERFIREQATVVMRAARMEVALHPAPPATAPWHEWVRPWRAIRHLRSEMRSHQQGARLQLLLERHLIEALTYLNDPSERHREVLVNGSFTALYASEEFRFGDKAAQHIAALIRQLGLAH